MENPYFSIATVERDTGLSKDVLRMWERRYGFPQPARDAQGERLYSAAQLARLRQIKRLMDLGHRPGKLMELTDDALATLSPPRSRSTRHTTALPARGADLEALLAHLKAHDAAAFQTALQQALARQGLSAFVQDTVAPLTRAVGQAWEDGEIEVHEEHLFTELTKRQLRQAIAALPATQRAPRILLTSLPEEQHLLGLLMAETLLTLEGAECIPLGTEMPLLDVVRAAAAHRADVVALSFSVAFPQRRIAGLLAELRQALPAGVDLWAGGGGLGRLTPPAGVRCLPALDDALTALSDWRQQHVAT